MVRASRDNYERDLILLVEPDPGNRARLEKIFRDDGWRVMSSDGSEPILANDSDEPAIILISADHDHLDEIDCIRRVRSHPGTAKATVVLLADRPSERLSIAALKEGADDVASEPFTKERLLARVRAHVCLTHLRREEENYGPRSFEQLRLSERRYRSLALATAAIILIADAEGRITEELSTWQKFTGQTEAEYRNYGWLDAIHPDNRAEIQRLFEETDNEKTGMVEAEFQLRRHDGEYRHMHLKTIPIRIQKGAVHEWLGALTDVTEAYQAEEALRASEAQMRLILESSTDFAIFTTDLEGKVTTWNAGAKSLLGYTDDEICGTRFHRIFLPEEIDAGAPEEEMKNALKHGRADDQRWHIRKDGSRFWADGFLMPLRTRHGEATGFLKIIRDCTEQKQTADKLRDLTAKLEHRVKERTEQLEENRARLRSLVVELNKTEQMERQRIAADLHDNPAQLLTAARLSLEPAIKAAGNTDLSNSLKNVEEIIVEATRATRRLMTDLSGPRVLEHDDLVVTIQWVAEKLHEDGLTVHLSHDPDRIPMHRDLLTLLFQTVRELLLNVLKHAGTSEAFVNIVQRENRVTIEVVDHGQGFEPAGKTDAPGPEGGFGLLNVQERLRWLGGQLTIDSAPGKGTRATISLPLEPETPSSEGRATGAAPTPEEKPPPSDKVTVVLVDDHRMVREGFRSLIEDLPDIEVVGEASDGVEGLEKSRELHPDVVVMDINMPRMNGLEATRHLLEEMPNTQVIGLSLHGRDDMADAIMQSGAVAYISKDEACETLCDVIRETAQKIRPAPEA